MNSCTKCGKMTPKASLTCMHCGAPTGTTGVVIQQNMGRLWGFGMLAGLIYGVLMSTLCFGCFLLGMGTGSSSAIIVMPLICLLCGAMFGVLYALIMQGVVKNLEKKWTPKRAEVASRTTVIVEGGANLNGASGWLFVTADGIEYYTHKVNFNQYNLNIAKADIQSIHVDGQKLVLFANCMQFAFVVNYPDRWLMHIKMNER